MSNVWTASVLTLFPTMFPGTLEASILGRAMSNNIWKLDVYDLRAYATDKHKSVDGSPVGGGAGMILRPDVMERAINDIHNQLEIMKDRTPDYPLVYPSPRGKPFNQQKAEQLAEGPGGIFICGRFEGLDQRLFDYYRIEEVSLGDFILAGGEVASMAMIEAVLRLLPGVLGSSHSLDEESFQNDLLEYPQYTRPVEWNNLSVPEILLSGHHKKIAQWRKQQSKDLTRIRRPDLWNKYQKKHS